jgi:hypothetical protein
VLRISLSPYDIHVFKRLICTPNSLCQKFRGFQIFYVTFNLYAALKIQAYRDKTTIFVRILQSPKSRWPRQGDVFATTQYRDEWDTMRSILRHKNESQNDVDPRTGTRNENQGP